MPPSSCRWSPRRRVDGGALLLTVVDVTLAISWHLTWAAAGGTLADILGRSRPRRILEGMSGIALIALALTIAR